MTILFEIKKPPRWSKVLHCGTCPIQKEVLRKGVLYVGSRTGREDSVSRFLKINLFIIQTLSIVHKKILVKGLTSTLIDVVKTED